MPKLAAPNQENLGKAGGQDVQRGHEPVTGQPSHHKELASEAVRESSEKRLNQKLTDGKPGDDQPKLEVGGSFLGNVDGKKGNDEPQPHDHDGSRQSDQDQFFSNTEDHMEKS